MYFFTLGTDFCTLNIKGEMASSQDITYHWSILFFFSRQQAYIFFIITFIIYLFIYYILSPHNPEYVVTSQIT